VGKSGVLEHKAAISLNRVKIEESYYGGPIRTHQRSFGCDSSAFLFRLLCAH